MKHAVTALAALLLPACTVEEAPPAPAEPDATLARQDLAHRSPALAVRPEMAHVPQLDTVTAEAGAIVTLASLQQHIVSMAVHGGTAYWSTVGNGSGGSVYACALKGCGGQPTILGPGTSAVSAMTADSENVYWGGGSIYATPVDGGASITLASLFKRPLTVAVNASHLFWGAGAPSGDVEKCALPACSNHVKLAEGQDYPQGIAMDSANVYWTTSYGGTVVSEPLGGGTPSTLWASPNSGAWGIAVDASAVYWTNYNLGTVMSCPIHGCNGQPTILASGQSEPIAVATDATNVYFVNYGTVNNGALVRVPLAGGAQQTLASAQSGAVAVSLTKNEVVWATFGAVLKTGK